MIRPTYGQIAKAQACDAWAWFGGLVPPTVEERGTRYDLGQDIEQCLKKGQAVVEKLAKDFAAIEGDTPEQILAKRQALAVEVRAFEALEVDPIDWEPIPDSQLGRGPLPPAALGALIECGVVKPRIRKPSQP